MNMDMLTSINIVLGIFLNFVEYLPFLREMKLGADSNDGLL
jgi:hypothetical protein